MHENAKIESGENMLCTELVSDIQNNFCTQHVLQKEELLTKIYLCSYWYGESRFVLCFKDLVKCQIENKCCMEALKSFKRFKIHSLNSKNPEDVKIHFMKIVAEYHELVSIHTEGDLSNLENKKIQEKIDKLLRIADLCQMKCELFRSLNDIETYCLWTHYTIWFLYESYGESLKFRKDIPHAKLTLLKLR